MEPIQPKSGKSVRFPLLASVCLVFLASLLLIGSVEAQAARRVLLLESYHNGLAWSESIQKGMAKVLEEQAPGVEIVIEYLDAVRLGETGESGPIMDAFGVFLQAKLKAMPPDVIIAADNPALDYMLKRRKVLAPGIPIVFCGINNFRPEMIAGHAGVTGVAETPSFSETIDAALRLWPQAENLLVLGETSVTYKANEALLEQALTGYRGRLKVMYFIDPDIEAISARLSSLTPDWLVLPMARPREAGRIMTARDGAMRIAKASRVPVLSCWDFWMDSGVLGGKVVSGLAQGEAAGAMAVRILNGAAPESIPVAVSPNVFEFDYAAMARFGLDVSKVPPESQVFGKPVSFYHANYRLVWTYTLFTGLLLCALLAMAMSIRRGSRAERKLGEQIRFMTTLLEALPNPVFHKDIHGVYLGCNRAFEELFGHPRERILGHTAFDIAPPEGAAKYQETDREAIETAGKIIYEWHVESPSGIRPVLFSKAAYLDAEGRVAGLVGVGTDLTEIRNAQTAMKESEAKYRTLFETMAQGVVYQSPDGTILSANPAACSILGLSMDQLLGRTSLDPRWRTIYADGSDMPGEEHPSMVALQTGKPVYDVVLGVFNPEENGYRWIVVNAMPEFLPDQERPYRAYASFEDITRLKRAEEALRESESRYRLLLAGMREGFASIDLEGNILECNDAFTHMLGRSREEILAATYQDVTPERWHAMERHIMNEQVLTRGYSEMYEKEYLRADGRVFPVELRAYLRRDIKGNPAGIWAIVRDITEQKRMQEIMVQNEKMMSVGGLAAGMAHEINNPLGGIIQSAQVILSRLTGKKDADRRIAMEAGCDLESMSIYIERRGIIELVSSLREAAMRASRIVSNMLDFSRRVDSGKVTVGMNIICDAALELVANDFDMNGGFDFKEIEVLREYDGNLPPVLCAPTQIEQVLVNILRNAAQAMSKRNTGGRNPRIVLRAMKEKGFVRVEVEDNGPGMTEQVRRQVFEPFFTTKKPGEGTGLGLSVSYYIVATNHDGQMHVESEPGAGTKFIIKLPYSEPDQMDAGREDVRE